MKRANLIFSVFLLPLDFLMLITAGIFVYYLRFSALVVLRPVIFEIQFGCYLLSSAAIFLVWLIVFALTGLYNLSERRHFSKEFSKIFLGCSVGTMLIVLFIFFNREFFSSRFIVLAGWLMTIIFVSVGRVFIHYYEIRSYRKGKGLEPILVFGSGREADQINDYIQKTPELGYKVIGRIGNLDDLFADWLDKLGQVNQIIQANPGLNRNDVFKLAEFCKENQIVFKYTADIFDALASNVKMETINGIPVIVIQRTSLEGWGRIVKRFSDIFFSFFILLLLLPVFLILGLIIKIDSNGQIFVGLERIGERGKKFRLYKFRSMIKNAAKMKKELVKYNERNDGPLFKLRNDPRITKFGKILRQFSLDELPQLFNVLRGEMSLVGPRPHEPEEVALYRNDYKQLLTIKPGITGLAQISGRSTLSFKEEARLDIYYIENWSIMFDLQIIFKTIPAVILRKNAV